VNDDTIQPPPPGSPGPPVPADDLAILAVLAALDRQPWEEDFLARGPAELGESAETLTRLYTEALGLFPGEHATPPPPRLKERLMAIVHGDETQEVEPAAAPEPEPEPPPVLPPVAAPPEPPPPAVQAPPPPPAAPPAPVASMASAPRRPASGGYPRPVAAPPPPPVAPVVPAASGPAPPPPVLRPVRRSRWILPLAAMLFLALGLSGFLLYGLWQQGEKIGDLTRDRNELAQRLKSTGASLDGMRKEMADLRARAALMTSPGVEIMPLKPTGQVPLPEGAYGMLFVAADHQHWHLALHGLTPAPAGRRYQLWFVSPQGTESGGTFTAMPGTPMDLSSERMPAGIQAITVTLESAAATPAGIAPSGPEALRAGPPVKVL